MKIRTEKTQKERETTEINPNFKKEELEFSKGRKVQISAWVEHKIANEKKHRAISWEYIINVGMDRIKRFSFYEQQEKYAEENKELREEIKKREQNIAKMQVLVGILQRDIDGLKGQKKQ